MTTDDRCTCGHGIDDHPVGNFRRCCYREQCGCEGGWQPEAAPADEPRHDPYGGKYNADLTDYRAKVLAECDGTDCPNPAAHGHTAVPVGDQPDTEAAWQEWWRSTFFPRDQWSQFHAAFMAGWAARGDDREDTQ